MRPCARSEARAVLVERDRLDALGHVGELEDRLRPLRAGRPRAVGGGVARPGRASRRRRLRRAARGGDGRGSWGLRPDDGCRRIGAQCTSGLLCMRMARRHALRRRRPRGAPAGRSAAAPDRMEIIEIGAVQLRVEPRDAGGRRASRRSSGRWSRRVLSDFCTRLDLRSVSRTSTARRRSRRCCRASSPGSGASRSLSPRGAPTTSSQLRRDCRRARADAAARLREARQPASRSTRGSSVRKPMGMKRALAREGIPLAGSHHRALDDARNIARLGDRPAAGRGGSVALTLSLRSSQDATVAGRACSVGWLRRRRGSR